MLTWFKRLSVSEQMHDDELLNLHAVDVGPAKEEVDVVY